jgi:hypothetical protein
MALPPPLMTFKLASWAQVDKTFYTRNLQMFVRS